MSVVAKLTCPECGKVLRPARPIAVGKKVRCPKCEHVFAATAEDEPEEEAPEETPKKGKKKKEGDGAAKKEAPAAAQPAPAKPAGSDDDEGGTYGYIKEEEEEPEEEVKGKGKGKGKATGKSKKPVISYVPDVKVKDLRGPATAKVMTPSSYLMLAGLGGFIGWLGFLLLLVLPAVFPLSESTMAQRPSAKIGPGLSNSMSALRQAANLPPAPGSGDKKVEEEGPSFFDVWGCDFSALAEQPWYLFFPALMPILVGAIYSGICTMGAVKMQNIESRPWGIASSIMAMLPFNVGGIQIVLGVLVQYIMSQADMDAWTTNTFMAGIMTVAWLISLGSGVYALITLMDEDVVAGFEYVPD
jgi:hypothetical protein